MRLYLAGPMSNLPAWNHPAFHTAAARLRAQGHEVVSPAEMHEQGTPWAVCLRADLKALLDCEAVAVLPGWRESRGALLETLVARQVEMPVLDAETLLPA